MKTRRLSSFDRLRGMAFAHLNRLNESCSTLYLALNHLPNLDLYPSRNLAGHPRRNRRFQISVFLKRNVGDHRRVTKIARGLSDWPVTRSRAHIGRHRIEQIAGWHWIRMPNGESVFASKRLCQGL